MAAAYDTYDYPAYWKGREYEHAAEFLAIKKMLLRIPRIEKTIEIGAGFGRLLSAYQFRSKKIVLTDPSAKLIAKARSKYKNLSKKNKSIEFTQSSLENLKNKYKSKSFDLAIMVRVLHHIKDIETAFNEVAGLLKPKGYFILEFANKNHLKANIKNIFKGNLTYPISIFPIDIRSKKHIKKNTLPFINFHPDQIVGKLKEQGFEIIEIRSVSNIRSTFMKRFFPTAFLLDIEEFLQIPFSKLNFGPSQFILARKK